MQSNREFQRGFSLVEMIVVIAIMGVLGGMIAMLIRGPVQGYVDSARRADISDIADIALYRITHDLRQALPNSVRVWGVASSSVSCNGNEACYLEFIPMTGGGRYRAQQDCSGVCTGDVLDFTNPAGDASFDVLEPMPIFAAGASGVVVDNLGVSGVNAYDVPATNRATVDLAATSGITVVLTAPMPSPSASPSNSFHVISTPVTYVCKPGVGGTLTRYWGYDIQAAQPVNAASAPLSTASSAVLASNVSACSFVAPPTGLVTPTALVPIQMTITESGESISLYGTAHISNVP